MTRQIKRRKQNEEKEFLLEKFTTLMFLTVKHLKAQQLPKEWGIGNQKKNAEKELLLFLKKHGAVKNTIMRQIGLIDE